MLIEDLNFNSLANITEEDENIVIDCYLDYNFISQQERSAEMVFL